MNLLTTEEDKKVRNIIFLISEAYWTTWFGHPIHDHHRVDDELSRAKKMIEELGV
jgi:hypothetical protein